MWRLAGWAHPLGAFGAGRGQGKPEQAGTDGWAAPQTLAAAPAALGWGNAGQQRAPGKEGRLQLFALALLCPAQVRWHSQPRQSSPLLQLAWAAAALATPEPTCNQ